MFPPAMQCDLKDLSIFDRSQDPIGCVIKYPEYCPLDIRDYARKLAASALCEP